MADDVEEFEDGRFYVDPAKEQVVETQVDFADPPLVSFHLADNQIRTVMSHAATRHEIGLRSISFKGAVQTLQAFQPVIAMSGAADPAWPPTSSGRSST